MEVHTSVSKFRNMLTKKDITTFKEEKHSSPQEPVRVLFVSHDTGMLGAQRTLLTLLSAIDRSICSPLLVVPYEYRGSRVRNSDLGSKACSVGSCLVGIIETAVFWSSLPFFSNIAIAVSSDRETD